MRRLSRSTARRGHPARRRRIPGDQLPAPPQKFGGKIERTTPSSKPYWPARIVPPKGAPNVLLIMTDDVGLRRAEHVRRRDPDAGARPHRGQWAALHEFQFHRAVLADARRADHRPQPSLGRLRRRSPSRRPAIPVYDSFITKDKATIGKILKDNGYRTSWFGKNHNTPAFQASQDRPVRPVADRHGLRVLLRLHGRRHQPVAAGQPCPQHHVHLSVPWAIPAAT